MSNNPIAARAREHLDRIDNRKKQSDLEKKRDQNVRDIESGVMVQKYLTWLREEARNEKDIKIRCPNIFMDHNLLFGDLRLSDVSVMASAQMWKSASAFLSTYFYTEKGLLSGLFTFAKSNIRNKLVASTVKPLYENNDEVSTKPFKAEIDNTMQRRTDAATLYTAFVNNPSTDDSVAVPAELASITVDFIMVDEFSQSDPAIVATLPNRMNAGVLESRPIRKMSTPGKKGMLIDREIETCTHVFEPMTRCPHCGELASLLPTKALLKTKLTPNRDGDMVPRYYDSDYTILNWFHHDPEDPENTAYVGCEHCGHEIPQESIAECRLYEQTSKQSAVEFSDSISNDLYSYRKVGLLISPLVKPSKRPLAVQLIKEGLNHENPIDYLQQRLGIATESDTDGISLTNIKHCIRASNEPITDVDVLYDKYTLLGLDQARGSHYVCAGAIYVPIEGDKAFKFKNTIREISHFTRVSSAGLPELLRKLEVEQMVADAAPDFTYALELKENFNSLICLQKKSSKEVMRENAETESGGIKLSTWDLDNQFFLNTVVSLYSRINTYGERVVRLPRSFKREIIDPPKNSPITHLTKLTFDAERGLWTKASDCRCDYVYGQLFFEAAVYYTIFHRRGTGWLEFFAE